MDNVVAANATSRSFTQALDFFSVAMLYLFLHPNYAQK
jgi:hypothetical protein